MADVITELISEQRKRLVASILGHAEREIYADLTPEQRAGLRKKVLESVGVFSDFALDCVRASTKDWTVNEEALRVLNQVSRDVSRLHRDAS